VTVEENGEGLPKDKLPPISFTLRADGRATVRTPGGEHQSKSCLDPAREPKTIGIVDLSGPFKAGRNTVSTRRKATGGR
jgi:hypothetical protein